MSNQGGRKLWQLIQRLWVIWGQCCPTVAAAPSLPNGPPITQLSPYFTQKPGRTRRENPISAWQLPYLIIKMTSTLPTMTKDEHILIYPRLQYGQKLATISDHYWRQSRHYLRAKASQSRIWASLPPPDRFILSQAIREELIVKCLSLLVYVQDRRWFKPV